MARAETATDRRAEIIAAAIAVLARDGIAETTTRKIAAEAKVNQASLRYYFGSKDDLLFAVLQEMMRLTQEIVRANTPMDCSLREAVQRSLRAFWQHIEAMPELQVMQYELTLYALRNPASAWLAKEQYDGYTAVVEEILRHHFAVAGHTCPIPLVELARFIVGGLDGMILQFVSVRDIARARQDLDHLITAVVALAGNPVP
jgi:AcrR family transcriptional regulator